MTSFTFSEKHEGDKPPVGVVSGTLVAGEGTYDIKIVYEKSGYLFAGPVVGIRVPASGSRKVELPINRCRTDSSTELRTATVMAQFKLQDADEYEEGDGLTINYRCR
jgi:hypothetical protein